MISLRQAPLSRLNNVCILKTSQASDTIF